MTSVTARYQACWELLALALDERHLDSYLKDGKVRPVPGSEEGAAVRAETSLVDKRSGEPVPGGERTSVDTSDLVVTKSVTFVLGHEPLHTKEVQVPLVAVVPQLADLETGVRLPAIVVAVAPPLSAGAADTADGNVGTNATALALLKRLRSLVNLGLDLGVAAVLVVVDTMLRGDSDLEESKQSNQHGHHALGLAKVGHDVE